MAYEPGDLAIKMDGYKLNIRSVGIIIHNGKVLLHKRKSADYYALLGGHVRIGESSQDTVKREMQEELGKEIEITGYISTIENFFELKDLKYHEIMFVYKAEFCDEEDKKNNVLTADYLIDDQIIIDFIEKSTFDDKRRIISYLEQWLIKNSVELPTGNISIITDAEDKKIVVINDLRFKRSKRVDWDTVEGYLKEHIGECTEILDTNEMIYIGSDFPDEYAHSKDTKVLRGPNEYAKANASVAIKELIQIASNKTFSENHKAKHNSKAKYGWYRYDTRFAIPKYDNDGELIGYNIFKGRLVIRHSQDDKLYLYDILRIKKETSEPLE